MTSLDPALWAPRQARAVAWFTMLRDQICAAFEALEDEAGGEAPAGRFTRRSWRRAGEGEGDAGGGVAALIQGGRVFEKVGVNISAVSGVFSDAMRAKISGAATDGRFWAAGISLVAHMASPLIPAVHMNTRMIVTRQGWFGGGADITPCLPDEDAVATFHAALRAVCDAHGGPERYADYSAWCDRYFFLPHRNEPRGAGGIFYDELNSGDWEADFAFTQAVGGAFRDVFPQIVRARLGRPWTAAQRQAQLVKRGRYVEFNLLHDRGTTFGLQTGGDVEAILMSLPPLAAWP